MIAMKKPKTEIVTFKADPALLDALKDVPNRSEFIRAAVLTAIDSACPVCNGTGILTPEQKRHWDDFAEDHTLEECGDCHENRLVCTHASPRGPHRRR